MKSILAFWVEFARVATGGGRPIHNDNLRANQERERTFGPWRALVGL